MLAYRVEIKTADKRWIVIYMNLRVWEFLKSLFSGQSSDQRAERPDISLLDLTVRFMDHVLLWIM